MTIHADQLRGDIPIGKLDTDVLDRANHTGTQPASTISDINDAIDARILAAGIDPKTLDMKEGVRIRMSMDETTFDAGGFSASQQSLTIASNDRIFIQVTDSADKSGIYIATVSSGTFSVARSADFDATSEVTFGATIPIIAGTKAGYRYVLTNNTSVTVGTTELAFNEYAPASALVGDGTTISITGLTVSVLDGGIGTNKLANFAVTKGKMKIATVPYEVPSGTVNSTNGTDGNGTFVLEHSPVVSPYSLCLKRNGVECEKDTEYTLSGATITFQNGKKPRTDDWLTATYEWDQDD